MRLLQKLAIGALFAAPLLAQHPGVCRFDERTLPSGEKIQQKVYANAQGDVSVARRYNGGKLTDHVYKFPNPIIAPLSKLAVGLAYQYTAKDTQMLDSADTFWESFPCKQPDRPNSIDFIGYREINMLPDHLQESGNFHVVGSTVTDTGKTTIYLAPSGCELSHAMVLNPTEGSLDSNVFLPGVPGFEKLADFYRSNFAPRVSAMLKEALSTIPTGLRNQLVQQGLGSCPPSK